MAIPTTGLDETAPAGTEAKSLGDNRIREYKIQVREVMEVDHDFPSSGNSATAGQHKQVTLQEQADLGTGAVGATILGSQTVSGKGELVYTDEDDNDIQFTSSGKIKLSSGRLENNTNLTARNAAGSADVNIVKVNASDAIEIPNGTVLSSSSAATTDPMIPNKKYVDDTADLHSGFNPVTTGLTKNTVYQAAEDGFVYVHFDFVASGYSVSIFNDNSNPPTTLKAKFGNAPTGLGTATLTCPVRKNSYYKVTSTDAGITLTNYEFWPLLGS